MPLDQIRRKDARCEVVLRAARQVVDEGEALLALEKSGRILLDLLLCKPQTNVRQGNDRKIVLKTVAVG
jgi:hypothetical protein